jgi:hypothetical protein
VVFWCASRKFSFLYITICQTIHLILCYISGSRLAFFFYGFCFGCGRVNMSLLDALLNRALHLWCCLSPTSLNTLWKFGVQPLLLSVKRTQWRRVGVFWLILCVVNRIRCEFFNSLVYKYEVYCAGSVILHIFWFMKLFDMVYVSFLRNKGTMSLFLFVCQLSNLGYLQATMFTLNLFCWTSFLVNLTYSPVGGWTRSIHRLLYQCRFSHVECFASCVLLGTVLIVVLSRRVFFRWVLGLFLKKNGCECYCNGLCVWILLWKFGWELFCLLGRCCSAYFSIRRNVGKFHEVLTFKVLKCAQRVLLIYTYAVSDLVLHLKPVTWFLRYSTPKR